MFVCITNIGQITFMCKYSAIYFRTFLMKDGEVLHNYLNHKRLSKTEFAKKLDIHRNTLYAYFETDTFRGNVLDSILALTGHDSLEEMKAEFLPVQATSNPATRYKGNPEQLGVPVYNVDITATAAENMDNFRALEPEYYLNIPFFLDCDFAGRVVGDSMFPRYRHGAIIVCKKITGRRFIEYGLPYLIITKTDNFRTLKYLKEDPKDKDHLWLVSHNSETFPPQQIPKDEILELYLVKGQIDQ